MRKARAVSTSGGEIPRTPSIVLSSTGQKQVMAMMKTFGAGPMPMAMMTIGTIAAGGMARRKLSVGVVAWRTALYSPISSPNTMPKTMASASPMAMFPRLTAM